MRHLALAAALALMCAPAAAAEQPPPAAQKPAPEYGRPGHGGHPAVQGAPGAVEATAPDIAAEATRPPAEELAGTVLLDPDGVEVGEVEAIVDADGVPAALVDRGGRFSIGAKRVLVPLPRIQPSERPGYALLDMDEAEIAALPEHVPQARGQTLEEQQIERRMEGTEGPLGVPPQR